MKIFDILFHLLLFLEITSGLKCHECSDLSGSKSCSSFKFTSKDCNLPIFKNEKAVCKSSWKEGTLDNSECSVASVEEETGCSFKGEGSISNRTICICDTDFCLDKPQPNSITNRRKRSVKVEPASDVECYICGGDGQPSCGDGDVDKNTLRKVCDPGEKCFSVRDLATEQIKRECSKPKAIGGLIVHLGCTFAKGIFYCVCDTDLCLGDGQGGDVTLSKKLTCYQCDGDCEDLNKSNKQLCPRYEFCYSVAKNRIITHRGCKKTDLSDYMNVGKCFRNDDDEIKCLCNTELCIGDGKGDNGQKPASFYSLRCYQCSYYDSTRCESEISSDSVSKLCQPGEVCASVIHDVDDDGRRERYCYKPVDEKVGQCLPLANKRYNATLCLCDNADLCIGDGKGNDAQLPKETTQIPNLLKCYQCSNCDKVNRNTPMVSCPDGHCIKSTNNGIVSRSCGTEGTVGKCVGGICACNDKDGCNGSRGLTATASCSVGLAIFVSYINLN